jgi:hypothetical protein
MPRDYSTLREQAQSAPEVMVDSETLLKLLDAAETIVVAPAAERRKRGPRDPRPHTQEDEDCARWMFERLQERQPDVAQPNFASWADHVRLMRERDGRTHRQIGGLFRWAQGNTFWCRNIRSPDKLRKQWDRLTDERRAELEQLEQPAGGRPNGKINFAGADRSGDQATQDAFMQRHGIEVPTEEVRF